MTKEIQHFCSINLSVKKVFFCESFKYIYKFQIQNCKNQLFTQHSGNHYRYEILTFEEGNISVKYYANGVIRTFFFYINVKQMENTIWRNLSLEQVNNYVGRSEENDIMDFKRCLS